MYTFDLILRKLIEQNLLTSYDDNRHPFPLVFTQIKFTKLVAPMSYFRLVCTEVIIEGGGGWKGDGRRIGVGREGTRNTIYIGIDESDDLLHEF